MYDFLDLRHSYVSVVELGLYESTRKTYEAASAKGFEAHTPDWNAEIATSLQRGSDAMAPRLFPAVPEAKYLCFYPMDRKRGEQVNWYTVPFADRQRMMHDHGLIGRRYGDVVKQIISGSIGMDDWEWGVDLFADDPVVFKKLIYEMRFDEVSAVYALFGQFFISVRLPTPVSTDSLTFRYQADTHGSHVPVLNPCGWLGFCFTPDGPGERREGVGLSQMRAYSHLPGGTAYPAQIAPHSSHAITLQREVFHKYRGFRRRFVVSPCILR